MRLSNIQVEFQDLVNRFFKDRVTSEYLRKRVVTGNQRDIALIEGLDSLGIFEGFEGLNSVFGLDELAIISEECGKALMPEPIVTRILSSSIAPSLMSIEERELFRSVLPSGGVAAVAFGSCCDIQSNMDDSMASGVIEWMLGYEGAQAIIGFANTSRGRRAFVFGVPMKGVKAAATTSLDLTMALTRIELKDAKILVLSQAVSELLEDALEILMACQMGGIAQRVIEMTCEYVKTRHQFGVPVGSFQAVQHKISQGYAETEALSSLSRFAAWSFANSPSQRRVTARAAILSAADVAPRTCEMAIQAHGGIGFTWEYDLHLYLRRATAIESAFKISRKEADELIERVSAT